MNTHIHTRAHWNICIETNARVASVQFAIRVDSIRKSLIVEQKLSNKNDIWIIIMSTIFFSLSRLLNGKKNFLLFVGQLVHRTICVFYLQSRARALYFYDFILFLYSVFIIIFACIEHVNISDGTITVQSRYQHRSMKR